MSSLLKGFKVVNASIRTKAVIGIYLLNSILSFLCFIPLMKYHNAATSIRIKKSFASIIEGII